MDPNINFNSSPKVKGTLCTEQDKSISMPSCRFAQSPTACNASPVSNFSKARLFRFHLMKEYSQFSSCRRRLEFSTLNQSDFYDIKHEPTVTVARRNERERNRVKLINMTFATLREHLPYSSENHKSKKMSKVDTLKAAIDYIRYLQTLIGDQNDVDAVLTNNCELDKVTSCSSYPQPITSSPNTSPTSTTSLLDSTFDGFSAEEDELLDFTNWF